MRSPTIAAFTAAVVLLLTAAARAASDAESISAAGAKAFGDFQMLKVSGVRKASPTPAPPEPAASCPASGGLLERISQAQACVADERVSVQTQRGRVFRRYAVAVMDALGMIRIARVLHGPDHFEVLTPGVSLTMRHENGINSDIQADMPTGGMVLALKYPLQDMPARVYTPYSKELATPEVVTEGIRVQSQFIDEAMKRLKKAGVHSRAFPDKLVADVVPRSIPAVLLMIEHINPDDFTGADQAESLVNKVLVVLAGNRKLAYAHNISPAGARGLVQMMRSTYVLLLRDYPRAGLNRDFAVGAADPVNAVMSQILLCDHDWAMIEDAAEIPLDRVGPYLAASYNGGPNRVIRAIKSGQMAWLDAPDLEKPPTTSTAQKAPRRKHKNIPKEISKWNIFMPETMKYVIFYHWVQEYFERKGVAGFVAASKPKPAASNPEPTAPASNPAP